MKELDVITEFKKLILEADDIAKTVFDTRELEKYYIKILKYIKGNSENKNEFINIFKKMLKDNQSAVELFEFCFRELSWIELKNYIIELMKNQTDITILDKYDRILRAYEEEWGEADLYPYYSK